MEPREESHTPEENGPGVGEDDDDQELVEQEDDNGDDDNDDDDQEPVGPEETLDDVHVATPEDCLPSWTRKVNLSLCPNSYKENSPREKRLLSISEAAKLQFANIFPDRKPLLLCPRNEYGVKKFVSTTLRLTLLPHSDLYGWEGCASFVAKRLSLELLDPPFNLPEYLLSPTMVMESQRGTCFDFSTLLCSLLLGAGYNAYCVSGYAVREMCLLDRSREECPLLASLLVDEDKGAISEASPQVKKYTVKTTRELKSNFESRQKEKKQAVAREALLKKQLKAQQLQEESECPPPDPLMGLRIHSWVLVLAGERDISDNFFIDPLTARGYPTSDQSFLGIESLWNQQNYWVNMQNCSQGCAGMLYDLGDCSMWGSVLRNSPSQMLLSNGAKSEDEGNVEDEGEEEEAKAFEMPRSWVSKITVSKQDIESGWPGGMRVTRYRKAKLELFAPYVLPDGLVTRLTMYNDLECQDASVVKELFQNRHDHLDERELIKSTNITTERFRTGWKFCLKSHSYVTLTPETEREMEFYSRARTDGLVRRVESQWEMKETFQDREDFLYDRHVVFAPSVKGETAETGNRLIEKVVERFHRNRSKPANEDTAERVFLLAERHMEVTYHLEDDGIVPSMRSFIKPQEYADTGKTESFTPNMVTGFQVPLCEKPHKNLYLYQMLVALMKEEKKTVLSVKESEKEVRAILASREKEESGIKLHISIYNTVRYKQTHVLREKIEPLVGDGRQRQEQESMDNLVDLLLAQLGNPETLSREEAMQLRLDCLAHFKQRIEETARVIQARLHKDSQELQEKQQWYQENKLTMSKVEEEEYLAYCSEAMLRIHVLDARLSRHKETAPQKYLALDENLRQEPRIAPHLIP